MPLQCAPSIPEADAAAHYRDESTTGYHLLFGQSGEQADQATIESLAENQSTLHWARHSLPKA